MSQSETVTLSNNTYYLNNLQIDLGHLAHLLDTVAGTILDCDFGPPGNRVPHMDRLNSLISVSLSTAERINETLDANFEVIGRTCERWSAPDAS